MTFVETSDLWCFPNPDFSANKVENETQAKDDIFAHFFIILFTGCNCMDIVLFILNFCRIFVFSAQFRNCHLPQQNSDIENYCYTRDGLHLLNYASHLNPEKCQKHQTMYVQKKDPLSDIAASSKTIFHASPVPQTHPTNPRLRDALQTQVFSCLRHEQCQKHLTLGWESSRALPNETLFREITTTAQKLLKPIKKIKSERFWEEI